MSTLTKHGSIPLFLFLFLFLTSIGIVRSPSLVSRFGFPSKGQLDSDLYFQIKDIAPSEKDTAWPQTTTTTATTTTSRRPQTTTTTATTTTSRRRLTGPGSWPPRCARKCGRCTPCKPVHVSVPPGTPVTEEYYPEAWRCKCGNRLYMP